MLRNSPSQDKTLGVDFYSSCFSHPFFLWWQEPLATRQSQLSIHSFCELAPQQHLTPDLTVGVPSQRESSATFDCGRLISATFLQRVFLSKEGSIVVLSIGFERRSRENYFWLCCSEILPTGNWLGVQTTGKKGLQSERRSGRGSRCPASVREKAPPPSSSNFLFEWIWNVKCWCFVWR